MLSNDPSSFDQRVQLAKGYFPRQIFHLVCGDALQRDDVSWLTPFREGVGALHRALDSLDRLAALRAPSLPGTRAGD